MNASLALLTYHIRTTLEQCGAPVFNLKINAAGIFMDCASEANATKAAEALVSAGCRSVDAYTLDGTWAVGAEFPAR